ncbi:MAG TPA: histidine kinase [Planctomycetota bacterium]|nr:histidine kinase [Planctomycetota bacterium]
MLRVAGYSLLVHAGILAIASWALLPNWKPLSASQVLGLVQIVGGPALVAALTFSISEHFAKWKWGLRPSTWGLLTAAVLAATLEFYLLMPAISGRGANWSLMMSWFFLGYWLTRLFRHLAAGTIAIVLFQRRVAIVRQRELLASQLRALRSQLQPHFLFNTLHAISVTCRTDTDAATRMLALLGDLLRLTLRERNGDLVSLAEEQELLQPYLALQQLRFPDRLRVVLDLPLDVLGCAVPDLLLQPLVENALEHGIERRPGSGTVHIAARRRHDQLEIHVTDDGAGIEARPDEVQLGVGLGTTKARLQALFGDAADLQLTAGSAGGATVTLRLPWRELARAA